MLNKIIKVDLHIHTKASEYKESESIVELSDINHLDDFLTVLDQRCISLFSFTDHNRFDFVLYKKVKEKLSTNDFKNLKNILPGVEFDVQFEKNKEACHIIAIFDDNDSEKLSKLSEKLSTGKFNLTGPDDFFRIDTFEDLLRELKIPVLLIACQRQSLSNKHIGTNSFNVAVDDPYVFLKTGFISALEYQSSKVQGILLDNLKEFPIKVPLVCGSDCHEWKFYPFHDKSEKERLETNHISKHFYFEVKALPTFMGLLMAFTSPNTRFQRNVGPTSCIQEFVLGEKIIKLSNGFNAIIGENGSGKSTILTGLTSDSYPNYIKSLLKKNNFSSKASVSPDKVKTIKQGEIISRNNSNSQTLFAQENLFPILNHSQFELNINNFYNNLIETVNLNIKFNTAKENIKNNNFTILESFENDKPYYITILISDNFSVVQNNYEKTLNNINSAMKSLLLLKDDINLDKDEKEGIVESIKLLNVTRKSIILKYNKKVVEARVKSIIVEEITEYIAEIKKLSSDADVKLTNYLTSKNTFFDSITDLIKQSDKISKNKLKQIPFLTNSLTKDSNGFTFISTAMYSEIYDLTGEFLKYCFNSQYQTLNNILKISTNEEFVSAISRANKENYLDRFSTLKNEFIESMENTLFTINESSTNVNTGNTLGEKSLVFYKFMTNIDSDFEVFAIDQPEDNISNIKIFTKLISYFETLRDKKQLIFITHNPMLVVNLDVDNVISLSNDNGTITGIFGCLENEDIIHNVANIMDGGIEALKRRIKVYE